MCKLSRLWNSKSHVEEKGATHSAVSLLRLCRLDTSILKLRMAPLEDERHEQVLVRTRGPRTKKIHNCAAVFLDEIHTAGGVALADLPNYPCGSVDAVDVLEGHVPRDDAVLVRQHLAARDGRHE